MIAPVAAVVLVSAGPSRAASLGLPGVDLEGWDVAAASVKGALTFTHAALGDQIPGLPQVWIRTEPLGPAPAPSSLRLVEFSCDTRRMRLRESYSYGLKDLAGPRRLLFMGRPAWRPLEGWLTPTFAYACDDR